MNKRILTVVLVLVVFIGVAIATMSILSSQDGNTASTENNSSESAAETSDGSADGADTASNDGGGSYVDYSEDAVANADGRVLLFFHASWCPQCVSIDNDIESQGVPSGVTIVKVDYDSNQDLRAEYGVTQQTTFVEVDSTGKKLQENFVAYSDPQLKPVLDALL